MRKILYTVRSGFTLIEILVTVIVIGVLAAVVIPAITQQATSGDASRIVQDLNNVRTGIETFTTNVRQFPGDIEDLQNSPSTTADRNLAGGTYTTTDVSKWNGPYLEKPTPEIGIANSGTSTYMPSGFSSFIYNSLFLCNSAEETSTTQSVGCNGTGGNFVAIKVGPMTSAQFELVNAQIDGVETAGSGNSFGKGKLRFDGVLNGGFAYFLALPYYTQ